MHDIKLFGQLPRGDCDVQRRHALPEDKHIACNLNSCFSCRSQQRTFTECSVIPRGKDHVRQCRSSPSIVGTCSFSGMFDAAGAKCAERMAAGLWRHDGTTATACSTLCEDRTPADAVGVELKSKPKAARKDEHEQEQGPHKAYSIEK